jgi:hypothetical protein
MSPEEDIRDIKGLACIGIVALSFVLAMGLIYIGTLIVGLFN